MLNTLKFKTACKLVGVDHYTISKLTYWGIHQYAVDFIIDWILCEAKRRSQLLIDPLEKPVTPVQSGRVLVYKSRLSGKVVATKAI